MVERVTNQTLDSYMSEHIWKPLGMNSTTFRLQERPDIKSRRADMSMRASSGAIGPSPTRFFPDDSPDDHGGAGVFSAPGDYIKVLIAVLKNDGTLLKPATTDVLFSPCLSPASTKAFRENRAAGYQAYRSGKIGSEAVKRVEPPAEMNFALGGQVSEQGWRGGRAAGSLSWGGLPNLSWFIDRKTGIALLYSSQVIPPGDHASRAAFEMFEHAVYSGELGNLGRSDSEES
jgi:CubicO group peptidase (beta-lactamase class C family)